MAIVLCRIDDRLVHGQVVIGWGQPLRLERIVLVDDQVAESAWEQDLYRMALPPHIEIAFATVAAAAAQMGGWEADGRRTAILTGDIATMAALHRLAPGPTHRINLGGVHHRPGRVEHLPYVYLTSEELGTLRALEADGARITAQDVPTAAPTALGALP